MMYNYPFLNFSGLKRYSSFPYYKYSNLPNKKDEFSKPYNSHKSYIIQNKKKSQTNVQAEVKKEDWLLKNSEDSFFEIFRFKIVL